MRFKDFLGETRRRTDRYGFVDYEDEMSASSNKWESKHEYKFDFDRFFKDCAPYLDAIKGTGAGDLAKHGSRSAPDEWTIINWEPRPEPRDSPKKLHDEMNRFFKEKFGWAARSHAMFVTGDYEQAKTYGPISLIFPIGKFQSLWSPDVYDQYHVYSDMRDSLWREQKRPNADLFDNEYREQVAVATAKKLQAADWRFNTDLRKGLETKHEIMMFAPRFYIVRMWTDTHDEIVKQLKERGIVT